jgi:hypothetical protein
MLRSHKMSPNKQLADAIRRGQQRNKQRGLPHGRSQKGVLDSPRLSSFDVRFLELYEKGYSERQMVKALRVGRGTVHRTKKLPGV